MRFLYGICRHCRGQGQSTGGLIFAASSVCSFAMLAVVAFATSDHEAKQRSRLNSLGGPSLPSILAWPMDSTWPSSRSLVCVDAGNLVCPCLHFRHNLIHSHNAVAAPFALNQKNRTGLESVLARTALLSLLLLIMLLFMSHTSYAR